MNPKFFMILAIGLAAACSVSAQGTAFTYQGRLNDGPAPANGIYDLRFSIYEAVAGGTAVAGPLTNTAVAANNGLFTVTLDFGAGVFTGDPRWIEIGVRTNGSTADFTTLIPRQPVTPTPYAITAGEVTSANVARLSVPNTSRQATGVPIVTSGFVTSATVTDGGLGYTTAPSVTVNDSTGSGAVITASVSDGRVVSLTVNNPGSGYSSGATLTIGLPPHNAYQLFVSTNYFTSVNTLTNPNNTIAGTGAGLTSLNASQLTSGTVGEARIDPLIARINQIFPTVLAADGSGSGLDADRLDGLDSTAFWKLGGNSGTVPGQFLGTTDDQPLALRVNYQGGLRLQPAAPLYTVNVIAGSALNSAGTSVVGATICGGGSGAFGNGPHSVMGDYSTIGGGFGSSIGSNAIYSTIGGGYLHKVGPTANSSVIAGGASHAIGTNASYCAIGGGDHNSIGLNSWYSTIAGGYLNDIGSDSEGSAITGGQNNNIAPDSVYSTIAGGRDNDIGTNSHFSVISGGVDNNIANYSIYGTISGGRANDIGTNSNFSVVGGGQGNNVDNNSGFSTIGGGYLNEVRAGAFYGTVAGGFRNDIGTNSSYSTIGGGDQNSIAADARFSTIAGGDESDIGTNSVASTVGGGAGNQIGNNSSFATIAGGSSSTIADKSPYTTIGGGISHQIGVNCQNSTIGGGSNGRILPDNSNSTIAGGAFNTIGGNSDSSTIAGGVYNDIGTNSGNSVIGGGYDNNISTNGPQNTIAGGSGNEIGPYSQNNVISGGGGNRTGQSSQDSVISGGGGNAISPDGDYAIIPGGLNNYATNYAFAAGTRAKANHTGAFVWGDSTGADVASAAGNSVTMRASGGYRLFSNAGLTAGVTLASGGGAWTSISDRNAKEHFQPVDSRAVLEKVAALPVTTWNYKSQTNGVRHIGPVAQDFKAAFEVGESDTGITTIDADGVALAAIQGLNQKLKEESKAKGERIEALEKELSSLKQLVRQLAGKME